MVDRLRTFVRRFQLRQDSAEVVGDDGDIVIAVHADEARRRVVLPLMAAIERIRC